MKKSILWIVFILAGLWTLFIFANSMQSAVVSTGHSDVFTNAFVSLFDMFHVKLSPESVSFAVRKTAHAVEFLIQSALLGTGLVLLGKSFKTYLVPVWFVGLLTACVDEYIQLFSAGRSSQVSDIFVDFFGTLAGTLVCVLISRLVKGNKKGKIYYRR
jgi:VanZ family protein